MDYRPIIESRYNRENWQRLLHDIFGRKVKFWNTPSVVSTSSQFAKQALWLGTITLSDEQTISVYEVELADSVDIERNRRGIRDMLLTSWRNNGNAGAFMFCYRKTESVLRFSYVSESWSFADDGTYKKESTDTKRFTYLLGEGHRSRTAIQQFEKLKASSLNLKDLTKAFSVDAVSDMFFDGYKKQYEDIIQYVTGKRMVKVSNKWEEKVMHDPCEEIMKEFSAFANPEKAVRDYVKKLMGRLVFLQFLQKKGWLGVPVDKEWGSGDSEFIQNLFAQCEDKDHFVDNVLEPLFNDLNTERKGDISTLNVQCSMFNVQCKIPYLNGGLFERDATDETEFPLPAKYMQSLLDFFASYNFTIDENDPDDAEVGVDPEMLGRIFENLLEDNKDKGAFYTPKEIVGYMCRESLIAYLQTGIEDETTKEAIRQFVTTHDVACIGTKASPLWGRLEGALRDVKICDPAIGSGAFPMGLLKELFLCRTTLEGIEQNKAAEIKKHIIQQNIYGVDIERGAVDIARLRFWLSLIVDEETPQALPNLDYKIVEGNSLITTFDGQYIDLSTNIGTSRLRSSLVRIRPEKKALQAEQRRFYTLSGDEKYRSEIAIKNHILNIIWYQLDYEKHSWEEATIEQTGVFGAPTTKGRKKNSAKVVEFTQERQAVLDKCEKLMAELNNESKSLKERAGITIPFFEWETVFSDIFDGIKQGFDIVIGNPPYVVVKKTDYPSYKWNSDLYKMFFEKGLKDLINPSGLLSFITPKFYLVNKDDEGMRKFFMNEMNLLSLSLCNPFDVVTENVITFIVKGNTGAIVPVYKYYPDEKVFRRIENLNIIHSRSNPYSEMVLEIPSEVIDLLSKIQSSHPILRDITKSKRGAEVSKNYLRSNDKGILSLIGMDMNKYSISCNETYLDYGHKEYKRLKSFFNQNLIYLRRVDSCLEATTSEFHYGFNKNVYGIQVTDANYDLYYVLAILNAKVVDFYYKNKFSTKKEDVFPEIQTYLYEQLPIPHATQEEQNKIAKIVDKILQNKKEDSSINTSSMESEIDLFVYHLYDLTYDEVLIVDPKTPITREEYEINSI